MMFKYIIENLKHEVSIPASSLSFDQVRKSEEYQWCQKQLGEPLFPNISDVPVVGNRWDFTLYSDRMVFHFLDEDDAMLFKLTWGKNGIR